MIQMTVTWFHSVGWNTQGNRCPRILVDVLMVLILDINVNFLAFHAKPARTILLRRFSAIMSISVISHTIEYNRTMCERQRHKYGTRLHNEMR